MIRQYRFSELMARLTNKEWSVVKCGKDRCVHPDDLQGEPVMSLCDCNQGRLPCTCKTTEGETVMSKYPEIHEFDGAEFIRCSDFDRVTAERDALQARLNAADQEKDDLTFQLNDREGSRYDWLQAAQAAEKRVEVLEAQLADRDALLREIRFKEDGHGFRVCKLGSYYTDKIDAALSASAKPSAPKCETCHDAGEVYSGKMADQGWNQPPEPIMDECPDCKWDAPVERDERAEFEQHYRRHILIRDGLSGSYINAQVRDLWDAWQARAALGHKQVVPGRTFTGTDN